MKSERKRTTVSLRLSFGVPGVKVRELYLIMIRCGVDRRIVRKKSDVFSTCSIYVFLSKRIEENKQHQQRQKKFLFQSHSNFHFYFRWFIGFLFAHGAVVLSFWLWPCAPAFSCSFQLKPFSSSNPFRSNKWSEIVKQSAI